MTIDVRPAQLRDARGIAEVHVSAWRETYAHLVAEAALARMSVDQRELRWREWLVDGQTSTWVAVDGDRIVGFSWSGPSQDDDRVRDLELWAIYLLAGAHGIGAGQRLLDAALGNAPASLWVADDNPRAHAFYRRNGFEPDGVSKTGPLAGTDILEVRMVR